MCGITNTAVDDDHHPIKHGLSSPREDAMLAELKEKLTELQTRVDNLGRHL